MNIFDYTKSLDRVNEIDGKNLTRFKTIKIDKKLEKAAKPFVDRDSVHRYVHSHSNLDSFNIGSKFSSNKRIGHNYVENKSFIQQFYPKLKLDNEKNKIEKLHDVQK